MPEKKYYKIVNGKKVGYGAKGYRIAPGTPRGDRYCARSYGQLKKFKEAEDREDEGSMNYMAREMSDYMKRMDTFKSGLKPKKKRKSLRKS